jgi:hypothetical protein
MGVFLCQHGGTLNDGRRNLLKSRRNILIAALILAAITGGLWLFRQATRDDRSVYIDINFAGANREFATSAAQIPMAGTYDVGLGYFDIALTATAEGLIVDLKPSAHDLAWQGDLVFYTLDTQTTVPIRGQQEPLSIYDTSRPATAGGDGPLWVGDLELEASFRVSN